MAIDEQRIRRSLHTKLVEALGDDEAALLMEYLPPVGWADVATKRDVDALAIATKRDIDALGIATKRDIDALGIATKRDIDALAAATNHDLKVLSTGLRSEMATMRSDLHAEIANLKSTLLMWLVPTVIASITVSVTLSRVL